MRLKKQLVSLGVLAGVTVLALSSVASAHVVVRPAEVVTGGFQTFTVGVPNERDVPTTRVELHIPAGLNHVSPTQKPGWRINVDRNGETVNAITWSGSSIDVSLRDEFTFSAQVPAEPTELQWKAYQTYADGVVVAWDQDGNGGGHGEDENSGPFSVTRVVTSTSAETATNDAVQAANDAQTAANRALYIAIAGIAIGLLGIFLATRRT